LQRVHQRLVSCGFFVCFAAACCSAWKLHGLPACSCLCCCAVARRWDCLTAGVSLPVPQLAGCAAEPAH
jgi:hypothetical protein